MIPLTTVITIAATASRFPLLAARNARNPRTTVIPNPMVEGRPNQAAAAMSEATRPGNSAMASKRVLPVVDEPRATEAARNRAARSEERRVGKESGRERLADG